MQSNNILDYYTKDNKSALEAQRMAEFIAWGPAMFQVARIMIKYDMLQMLNEAENGMTRQELCQQTGFSDYAVKCLLEAALCMGIVLIDHNHERFCLSKTGWFLLHNPSTRVNVNFNHDVNYEGWFFLEQALVNGKPEGLKHFGDWPTVYEGLSQLPDHVRKSWLEFDHFYSDTSFPQALDVVLRKNTIHTLFDIGGNTGKWALECVAFDENVKVTVVDLPQQIKMMQDNVKGKPGAERIDGFSANLLDESTEFPDSMKGVDAIWMSQFLDCFSMEEIVSILKRVKKVMKPHSRIFIMETLWDRQRFDTAAFCLTMTSLYFTAIANGNSKMYNTKDMQSCIDQAGLKLEHIYDNIGYGHSILKCSIN